MAKRTNPSHEAKPVDQYRQDGLNLRELIRQQAGGSDPAAFQNLLRKSGLSRRDMRRLSKAYDIIQNTNYDYIISADGTGFNVFDRNTGEAITRSSRGAGNTKGITLADLLQVGKNVSRLAGFAAQNADKGVPVYLTQEFRQPRIEDLVRLVGDPEIDLVDYKPTTVEKGKSTTQTGGTKTPTTAASPATSASAKPSRAPGSTTQTGGTKTPQPNKGAENPYAGVINPVFEEALRKRKEMRTPIIDEEKLDEHMKTVRNYFSNSMRDAAFNRMYLYGLDGGGPESYHRDLNELTEKAANIYEQMVREGFTPDVNEITQLIQSGELEELENVRNFNTSQASFIGTAASMIPAIRGLGNLFGKGAVGMKSLASKYPNFAKWLASKGVAKPLQFPQTQTLPSVSRGAKDFLRERARTGAASKAMRYESGFEKGGKIAIQNSIDAAAEKATKLPQTAATNTVTLKSLISY